MAEPTAEHTIRSSFVVLPTPNIDTDQIIPARFLKTTDKQGLGERLFADWRYDESGAPRPDFPLNRPEARGVEILVGGHNFGCGSSREHAPWALLGFGFRAVVSTRFADIFHGNALKNGLLPITVPPDIHARLLHWPEPGARLTIDLEHETLTLPDGTAVTFPIDPFAKHCLLTGVDELGYLLTQLPAIEAYELAHPARVDTTVP
jgi:3-isopropylmalate/(R)-2-methylmalate dehydratase small subunit